MSNWRLVPATDEPQPTDLTDSELIGVCVILTHNAGEPFDTKFNVYWRAREKIMPCVDIAINRENA